MGKLIIDGNAVYEVDEECLRTRNVPDGCKVREAIERMECREDDRSPKKMPDWKEGADRKIRCNWGI